jgi:hypothetical protein
MRQLRSRVGGDIHKEQIPTVNIARCRRVHPAAVALAKIAVATAAVFITLVAQAQPAELAGTVLCRDAATGATALQKNVLVQVYGSPNVRDFTDAEAGYFHLHMKYNDVYLRDLDLVFGLGEHDVEHRHVHVVDPPGYYNSRPNYFNVGFYLFKRVCEKIDGHGAIREPEMTKVDTSSNAPGHVTTVLSFVGMLAQFFAIAGGSSSPGTQPTLVSNTPLPIRSSTAWPTRVDLMRDSRTIQAPFPGFRVTPIRSTPISLQTAPAAPALDGDGWTVASNSQLQAGTPYYTSVASSFTRREWGAGLEYVLGAATTDRSVTLGDRSVTSASTWRVDQLFTVAVSRRVWRALAVGIAPTLSVSSQQNPTTASRQVYSDGTSEYVVGTGFMSSVTPDLTIGAEFQPIRQLRFGATIQNLVGITKNVGEGSIVDRDLALGATSYLGIFQLGVDGDYSSAYGPTFGAGLNTYVVEWFEIGGGYVSTFHSFRVRLVLGNAVVSFRHGDDGFGTINIGGAWRF